MTLDDDDEIEKARAFFADHGLLPGIPNRFADDEDEAERARLRIISGVRFAARRRAWGHRALLATAVIALVAVAWGTQAVFRQAPAASAGTPPMLAYSEARPASVASAPGAATSLLSAARAVAAEPAPVDTGRVQYVARYEWLAGIDVSEDESTTIAVYPTLTRWWLVASGAVRVDESRAAPLDLNGRVRANPLDAPHSATSDTSPAGTIDPGLAARLPTDSAVALRTALMQTQAGLTCDKARWWQTQCLVAAVQTVYDQYVVSPALASAMWRVLAGESDLHTLGTTVDRLGRPATTVALPPEPGQQPQQVVVLLISTSTGAYLGTETVLLRDSSLKVDQPTVLSFSELTAARWVAKSGNTS